MLLNKWVLLLKKYISNIDSRIGKYRERSALSPCINNCVLSTVSQVKGHYSGTVFEGKNASRIKHHAVTPSIEVRTKD